MTNIAKFNVAISELIDVPNPNDTQHPYVTMATFVFADDRPNGNHQGIKVEEFPNVIRSAIGMPIKMNFTGVGVSSHGGSIPIGHIKDLVAATEGDVNQLIATAMLWKEEFPDEIGYLKDAHAAGTAPGLSYEIAYKDSNTVDGTQWISEATTLAATFVREPAYGSRTHLLALASLDEKERNEEILALAEQIKDEQVPITDNEGGNLMEEELEKLKAELVTLKAEAATKDSKITELETDLATKVEETTTLTAELNTIKTDAKTDSRIRQYVEAGFKMEADAEKAEKKKTIIASFEDDQWDEYLADLKAAKAAAPKVGAAGEAFASLALASLENGVPKIDVSDEDKTSLKEAMRSIARPYSA